MEVLVNINDIHLDRAHLRHSIPEKSLDQLKDSIREDGLFNALTVRDRPEGGYSLIAGRRRLLACHSLGWEQIPCRVIEPTHGDEVAALGENLIRVQMNPLEEATAVGLLHFEQSMSIRDIALYTHHGHSWVQDRLALLALPQILKDAVAQRVITMGAAGQLMLITDIPLRDYYLKLAEINGASVQQCQAWYQIWQGQQTLTQKDHAPPNVPPPPEGLPPARRSCWSCGNDDQGIELTPITFCAACFKAADASLHGPDEKPPLTPDPELPESEPYFPPEMPDSDPD